MYVLRVSGSLQGAFAAVYELDVDDDVNRVLFALREPLGTCVGGSPGRAAESLVEDTLGRAAGEPAGGVLRNVQHMAACPMRPAQPRGSNNGERALMGCLDAESALARLGVPEHLQRFQRWQPCPGH